MLGLGNDSRRRRRLPVACVAAHPRVVRQHEVARRAPILDHVLVPELDALRVVPLARPSARPGVVRARPNPRVPLIGLPALLLGHAQG
eukprot:4450006-Lingulodinium_polyedra.AAC.1